jgi:two-component system response regulator MprA
MRPVRVGICEDDSTLRSLLVRALREEDFEVGVTSTGRDAVDSFTASPPDLLVLDIGLPDADGRDVCQALRSHGVDAPVVFLTARETLVDRLGGFNAGGDDYVTKPFELEELMARIHALLRRAVEPEPEPSGLLLDPASHAVRFGDRVESLTPTEFRLLAALAARPGTVVRRRELVLAAWPAGGIVHDNTLDTYVGRLRGKLRDLGADSEIATARGVGYSLR